MDEKFTGKPRQKPENTENPPRSYLPPRPAPEPKEIKEQFANKAARDNRGANRPNLPNFSNRANREKAPNRANTANRGGANRPGQEQVAKRDTITVTLILEIVLAVLMVLLCMLLRSTDSKTYHKAKDYYWGKMKGEVSKETLNPVYWFEQAQLETLREGIEEAVDILTGQQEIVFAEPSPEGDVSPAAAGISYPEPLDGQGGWFWVSAEDATAKKLPTGVSMLRVPLSARAVYPTYGKLTSGFGFRAHPTTGQPDFHRGIDIAAPVGSDIYSAYPGTVAEIGYSAIYGNYIRIQHSDTVSTVYSHCSEILATLGAEVRQGERIAAVGSTGISTGPHLDFELLVQGVYVNPLLAFDMA